VNDGLDLVPMTDNALILEQTIDVAVVKLRYLTEIEIFESRAEVPALGKDGAPAQPRLKALQAQFLE
jgi:hypothetical protein